MSEAWEEEGHGAENDWGEESLESDLEEDDALPEESEEDPDSPLLELDPELDDDQ